MTPQIHDAEVLLRETGATLESYRDAGMKVRFGRVKVTRLAVVLGNLLRQHIEAMQTLTMARETVIKLDRTALVAVTRNGKMLDYLRWAAKADDPREVRRKALELLLALGVSVEAPPPQTDPGLGAIARSYDRREAEKKAEAAGEPAPVLSFRCAGRDGYKRAGGHGALACGAEPRAWRAGGVERAVCDAGGEAPEAAAE